MMHRNADEGPTRCRRPGAVSDEHGGSIRPWGHDVEVEPLDDGCRRHTDRVAIDAGWATLLVTAFAWAFYGYRQARWRRLAGRPPSRVG